MLLIASFCDFAHLRFFWRIPLPRIFFDNAEDAEKVSENIEEPVEDNLSINVDAEELNLALKQVKISPTAYSIAEVTEPLPQ